MSSYDRAGLEARLTEIGVSFDRDEPMSRHCSFRTGGNADLYARPADEGHLVAAVKAVREFGAPLYVLGCATNVLVPDEGLPGVVVSTTDALSELRLTYGGVYCGAGVTMNRLAAFCLENSLTGMEFCYGIPGSVGGAVYMNAGAYGGEIRDVITSAGAIAGPECGMFIYAAPLLDLGYRHSRFEEHPDEVILNAVFAPQPGDPEAIRARMDELMQKRRDKQPLDMPSAGSTFKRPEGHFAGALIEQCGLKGFSVGGAMVSPKHAGFVVNTGGATSADVLSLIRLVQERVLAQTGVMLEPEVRLLAREGAV